MRRRRTRRCCRRVTPTVHQYMTTVTHASGVDATSVELVQGIPAGFVVQGMPTAMVGGVLLAGSSCTVVGQQVTSQLGRRDAGSVWGGGRHAGEQ